MTAPLVRVRSPSPPSHALSSWIDVIVTPDLCRLGVGSLSEIWGKHMRRNKMMQGARLSGLMVQRLGLLQTEVIYMVRGPDYCFRQSSGENGIVC